MKQALTLGLLASIAVSAAIAAGAPSPKDFVADAIKGDNSEITMGQLAQQRGTAPGVRDFGRTLVTDHTEAKEQMAALAAKLNMTPPSDVKPDAKAMHDKLSGLSGDSFDREFVKGMIDDHKKDIAEFQKEANAKNGDVSTMAKMQLPTLQKHLRIAQSLQSGAGKSGKAPG